MPRLIDANALTDKFLMHYTKQEKKGNLSFVACEIKQGFADMVNEAPTVDAVEVVHAEWRDIVFDPMWRSMSATCSHCKVRGEVRVKSNECGFVVPDSDYCPHCGAKMDGGINK